MHTLNNKVVVITGAASGIGRALALACGRRGARLLLADLDEPGLARLSAELRTLGATSHSQCMDAGSEADIFALAHTCQTLFGAADVVVNNAGVTLVSSVEKLQTADAQWLMNINFWGVVHGCRAFLPQLRTRPQATLVNISSIFAMVSVPSQSMYNAAKAAVRGFSDALREELRNSPVSVLCVHPGGIRTHIVDNARMADLSLQPISAEQMRSSFALNARTSAEQAALEIVRAIETGQTRLLIGGDAKVIDWMYRLVPSRASAWVTALGRRRQLVMAAKSGTPDALPPQTFRTQPRGNHVNRFVKSLLLATYALAIASLLVPLPLDAGPMLRRISLILLAIHLLELVFVFRHVRRYKGSLATSTVLTLLFGLLHWKPLADAAKARQNPA